MGLLCLPPPLYSLHTLYVQVYRLVYGLMPSFQELAIDYGIQAIKNVFVCMVTVQNTLEMFQTVQHDCFIFKLKSPINQMYRIMATV